METVELIPAFAWICNRCGHLNHGDLIAAGDGNTDEHGRRLMLCPERVLCSACDSRFEVDAGEMDPEAGDMEG